MPDFREHMSEAQKSAYDTPIGEESALPTDAARFRHPEVYDRVSMWVMLTTHVGEEEQRRVGSRGSWHCSVSVWPRGRRANMPVAYESWKRKQRQAAQTMLGRYLANVGENVEPYQWEGEYALHYALPMTDEEVAGLEQ